MIATLTAQSFTTPTMSRPSFKRNANSAGAPLPLIPRRASAIKTPPHSGFSASMTPSASAPISVPLTTITSPSTSPPPREVGASDSGSGSSSENYLSIRPKRIRGVRMSAGLRKPEHSTPASKTCSDAASSPETTPRPRRSLSDDQETPRASSSKAPLTTMKLNLGSLKPRTLSESDMAVFGMQPSQSAPLEVTVMPQMVRKKSGEPLRSSLKGSRPKIRGSLAVVTGSMSTKSAPATPNSARAVHFDAQEHVKLFLAEQKPLAVSRDGSPTDDTSGTDNDFPSWIYGDGEAPAQSRMRLVMKQLNMPTLIDVNADVALEELSLAADGTQIVGRIRLRNLAFQKWVAVRFTFDSWQTTSEVSGKYSDTIDSQFDRFSFSIKLNDLMARIEGKTLQVAVRYSIDGREMWDNNHGRNYVASFSKVKPRLLAPPPPVEDDAESPGIAQLGDLRSKLEKVAKRQEVAGSSSSFLAPASRRTASLDNTHQLSSIPSSSSLKSRYDFGASLKNNWRSPDVEAPRHTRIHSYPAVLPTTASSSSIPFPSATSLGSPPVPKANNILGSPRDLSEAFTTMPHSAESDSDTLSPLLTSPTGRNHQRGYFDVLSPTMMSSAIRRTPPGTPSLNLDHPMPSPRHHSFPPLDTNLEVQSAPVGGGFQLSMHGMRMSRDSESSGSSLSTPSIISPGSSSDSGESSPSPSESLIVSSSAEGLEYSQFLNKFCFFTGPESPATPVAAAGVPRCPSVSSVEDLLSTPRTPLFPKDTLTSTSRCTSLDSISPSPTLTITPSLSLSEFRSGSGTPPTTKNKTPTSTDVSLAA